MVPHRKQIEFLKMASENPVSAFCAGIAAGKTTAGSLASIGWITHRPEYKGLIFSNTTKQLNTATLRVFMEDLRETGWIKDEHFVIGKDPQPFFKYKSPFPHHDGIWSFMNGAQVMTYSLESQIRGITVNWAWGDEIQDAQKLELEIVSGRVREGVDTKQIYTLTPPAYNPPIRDMIYSEKAIPVTFATTYDNAENLPAEFIPMLEKTYNKQAFDREVLAKDVTYASNRWVFVMDYPDVVSKILTTCHPAPDVPLTLSFDFNKNPLTALACQKWGDHARILREFRLEDSNLYNICARIKQCFPNFDYELTGDYSGKFMDNVLQQKFMNAYETISSLLGIPKHRWKLSPNPPHINSREQLNSILQHHSDFLIDKELCPFLVDDLYYVQAKEDGTIDKGKDGRMTHLLDCLRSFAANYFKGWDLAKIKGLYKVGQN